MRLLVITDLYPPIAYGGYERACAELVEGLRDRHDVTVLTSDLRRAAAPPLPWVRRELPHLGPERRALARVPRAAARAAVVTRRALDELRPDLVYVSSCLTVPQTAPCAAVQAGVPTVYRLSELWFASALYRRDRFVGYLLPGQRGVRRAWSWVVRAANNHAALRLDPRRRAAAGDLVVQQRLAGPRDAPADGAAGAGAHHLRRRVGRVRAPRPPAVGSTDDRLRGACHDREGRGAGGPRAGDAQARRTASTPGWCSPAPASPGWRVGSSGWPRRCGLRSGVELAGPLETDALGRLLQRAHAVVVPTLTHEAFGRVCVEAALARVPVVAARVGGIPEALHDGTHALLFPPGDAAACAAALAATLIDPASAEARVRRAFDHAQQFSATRFVETSEAFLEESAAVLGRA